MTEAAAPVLSGTTEFSKVGQRTVQLRDDAALLREYHVERVQRQIVDGGYQTVALQFPDELIPESTRIASLLQAQLNSARSGAKVYILADTSYSPCCVDEIAAQHVQADCVVHFGHACLNPVKSMPVIYVFGGYDIDVESVEAKFREAVDDTETKVLVLADPQYAGVVDKLVERVPEYKHMVPTMLKKPADGSVAIPEIDDGGYTQSLLPNRVHAYIDEDELSEYTVFFITAPPPSPSLVLHLTTLVSNVHLLQVQSPTQLRLGSPHSALMKRYKFVSQARTAATVGILINTLSLAHTHDVLKQVQDWVTQAGKKYYTFVVGKPNVAKLANFEVVDVWCVLGCPIGGIIVDCKDFYQPIITPYELNLALRAEVTWTGRWLIDFEAVLQMAGDGENDGHESESDGEEKDEDAPVFDVLTGTYVSTSKPLRRLQHVDVNVEPHDRRSHDDDNDSHSSRDLVERTAQHLTIRNTVSTAADTLRNKFTWQGLGTDYNNDDEDYDADGAKVEQGRQGTARGYTHDTPERT